MPNNALQDLISQQFLNSTPQAAFYRRFAGSLTGGGNRNYASWLKGMQDDFYPQYMGQLPDNPNQQYTAFLEGLDPMKQFQAMAPGARGERPGLYQPRIRRIG